jgi:hypothetical protein
MHLVLIQRVDPVFVLGTEMQIVGRGKTHPPKRDKARLSSSWAGVKFGKNKPRTAEAHRDEVGILTCTSSRPKTLRICEREYDELLL